MKPIAISPESTRRAISSGRATAYEINPCICSLIGDTEQR